MHAAAAAAAAATLDMEAVQRSLAAAAWRQGDLGAHLQGVIEEEDEDGEKCGTFSSQQQQQQQHDQHPWGGSPLGPGPLAQQSCVVKAVFGSYSHRGLMHDNEDRVSVSMWGHNASASAAASQQQQQQDKAVATAAAGGNSSRRRSSSPDINGSRARAGETPNGGDRSILELAAGARGLGYEWHQADSPVAAATAGEGGGAAATSVPAAATETVICLGQTCELPPVVAAGIRVALQGGFAAEISAMQEAAAAAADADAAPAVAAAAAAIDAAIEHLVNAPPAPPWGDATAAAAEQQQQQQSGRWGPLSVLRRRRSRPAAVEGAAVSVCWEPLIAASGGAAAAPAAAAAADGIGSFSGVYTLQKPLEAAKRDNSIPSILFLVCDGHDTHEAAAFVSKGLPLLAYRRLPQQLPLLQHEQLHAAGRTLFADLDTLMR